MTTRSRTGLFLSYRESIPRRRSQTRFNDDDEHERLIAPHISLDVALPPEWVDHSEQVEYILVDTRVKITTLDKLHAKHLLPGFSDRSQEEREIDALTTDITHDFRKCQELIQKIGAPIHKFPPNPSSSSQSQSLATKNVQRALAAKVQDLSAAFRKKQRVYMEKLQGHAIKNQDLLVASGAISLKGSEGMNAVDDDLAAAKHTRTQSISLSQSTTQQLTYDDDTSQAHVAERLHSLNELANSISSLGELFKDLSALIIDQGTLLDSIEYNIEQTAADVSEAAVILEEAKGYQGRAGRRKCILFLVLLVMLAITALIIKIQRERANQLEPGPTAVTILNPENTARSLFELRPRFFDPWDTSRVPTHRLLRRGARARRREDDAAAWTGGAVD